MIGVANRSGVIAKRHVVAPNHTRALRSNLTRALAAGGDLPSLVAALQQAERQRHSLESAIAATRHSQRFTTQTAKDLESQVLTKLADWRTTLRQDPPAARQVLRQLISNRIALEAVKEQGRRLYHYSGTFTIGGLFEGFLRPQTLASPKGTEHFLRPDYVLDVAAA